MKTKRASAWFSWLLTLVVLMTFSLSAKATPPPESGIWWNASQSGRGFVIEVQDQYFMLSAYSYDPDGEPVFDTSAGIFTDPTQFSGTVVRTTFGQCFNCPYRKPIETPVGTMTITFTSPSTANIVFLGESIQITRFAPAEYLARVPDVMLGEWAIVNGGSANAIYSGERLEFTSMTSDAASPRASGNRSGAPSNWAYAAWEPATQQIFVVLDSSPSYYETWRFRYSGLNRVDGDHAVYVKGSQPAAWEPSIGTRMNFQKGVKWAASAKPTVQSASTQTAAERDEVKSRQADAIARNPSSRSVTAAELQVIRALEFGVDVQGARKPRNAGNQ